MLYLPPGKSAAPRAHPLILLIPIHAVHPLRGMSTIPSERFRPPIPALALQDALKEIPLDCELLDLGLPILDLRLPVRRRTPPRIPSISCRFQRLTWVGWIPCRAASRPHCVALPLSC